MKKFSFVSFFLMVSVFITGSANAQINYDEAYSTLKLNLNSNLSVTKVEDGKAGAGATVGAKGIFFINPNIGFHSGASFSQIKSDDDFDKTLKVNYLDIPVGMSFRYNLFPDGSAESIIHFGLYYGLPLGKIKYDGNKYDAKNVVGLNIDYGTLFMLNEGMSMGFNIFVKNAFGDIAEDQKDSSYYSWGLGLLLQFM